MKLSKLGWEEPRSQKEATQRHAPPLPSLVYAALLPWGSYDASAKGSRLRPAPPGSPALS